MIEAYPLCWPPDYPRSIEQRKSLFKTTIARARDFVKDELKRLGANDPVISTNIPLKNDGDLRADWSRYKIADTGVAVYFTRNNQQICLCCDTYTQVHENLHAVGRTIDALRRIDRDGVSDFLNRTFTGFKALPESSFNEQLIWETLGLSAKPGTIDIVHSAYKKMVKIAHPDTGGSVEKFHLLQQAYEQAKNLFKA